MTGKKAQNHKALSNLNIISNRCERTCLKLLPIMMEVVVFMFNDYRTVGILYSLYETVLYN
ncbi:hypothetical protein Bca101_052398 [Brassica carinata]